MLNISAKIFLVFAIVLGGLASPVQAVDIELSEDSTLEGILQRAKLRIGIEAGYMPFEMIDKRSGLRQRDLRHGDVRRRGRQVPLIGFDIDIGIEMARVLGVKPVFVDTRWPSIIPALNLGRYDIIFGGMSVTAAREQKVDFANPFMTVGQTIVLNKKHQGIIKSYQDLNDPKYTVISKPATTGEAAVRELIPNCTYKPIDTEMAGAMQVLEGKADAFVYDLPFNAVFIAMHKKDGLIFLDKPFTTEPIAWAIRKNDPDFLKFLNDFLAEIKDDGRFDRIYNKWFKSTDWFKYVR